MLLVAAIPKFAAQAIRKVHDLDWKPLFFMSFVSTSIGAVIKPAGPENAIGMITAGYLKDPNDPAWKNDAGMNEWRDFMAKCMPGADITDGNYYHPIRQTQLAKFDGTHWVRFGHVIARR